MADGGGAPAADDGASDLLVPLKLWWHPGLRQHFVGTAAVPPPTTGDAGWEYLRDVGKVCREAGDGRVALRAPRAVPSTAAAAGDTAAAAPGPLLGYVRKTFADGFVPIAKWQCKARGDVLLVCDDATRKSLRQQSVWGAEYRASNNVLGYVALMETTNIPAPPRPRAAVDAAPASTVQSSAASTKAPAYDPSMSRGDADAVRRLWRRINLEVLMHTFADHLAEEPLFSKAKDAGRLLGVSRRALQQLKAVSCELDAPRAADALRAIAGRHVTYNVAGERYQWFGTGLWRALFETPGAEGEDVWTAKEEGDEAVWLGAWGFLQHHLEAGHRRETVVQGRNAALQRQRSAKMRRVLDASDAREGELPPEHHLIVPHLENTVRQPKLRRQVFSGNSRLKLGTTKALGMTGSFTLAMWLRPDYQAAPLQPMCKLCVLGCGSLATDAHLRLHLRADATLELAFNGETLHAATAPPIPDADWSFLFLTVDNKAGQLSVNVNNSSDSIVFDVGPNLLVGAEEVVLGAGALARGDGNASVVLEPAFVGAVESVNVVPRLVAANWREAACAARPDDDAVAPAPRPPPPLRAGSARRGSASAAGRRRHFATKDVVVQTPYGPAPGRSRAANPIHSKVVSLEPYCHSSQRNGLVDKAYWSGGKVKKKDKAASRGGAEGRYLMNATATITAPASTTNTHMVAAATAAADLTMTTDGGGGVGLLDTLLLSRGGGGGGDCADADVSVDADSAMMNTYTTTVASELQQTPRSGGDGLAWIHATACALCAASTWLPDPRRFHEGVHRHNYNVGGSPGVERLHRLFLDEALRDVDRVEEAVRRVSRIPAAALSLHAMSDIPPCTATPPAGPAVRWMIVKLPRVPMGGGGANATSPFRCRGGASGCDDRDAGDDDPAGTVSTAAGGGGGGATHLPRAPSRHCWVVVTCDAPPDRVFYKDMQTTPVALPGGGVAAGGVAVHAGVHALAASVAAEVYRMLGELCYGEGDGDAHAAAAADSHPSHPDATPWTPCFTGHGVGGAIAQVLHVGWSAIAKQKEEAAAGVDEESRGKAGSTAQPPTSPTSRCVVFGAPSVLVAPSPDSLARTYYVHASDVVPRSFCGAVLRDAPVLARMGYYGIAFSQLSDETAYQEGKVPAHPLCVFNTAMFSATAGRDAPHCDSADGVAGGGGATILVGTPLGPCGVGGEDELMRGMTAGVASRAAGGDHGVNQYIRGLLAVGDAAWGEAVRGFTVPKKRQRQAVVHLSDPPAGRAQLFTRGGALRDGVGDVVQAAFLRPADAGGTPPEVAVQKLFVGACGFTIPPSLAAAIAGGASGAAKLPPWVGALCRLCPDIVTQGLAAAGFDISLTPAPAPPQGGHADASTAGGHPHRLRAQRVRGDRIPDDDVVVAMMKGTGEEVPALLTVGVAAPPPAPPGAVGEEEQPHAQPPAIEDAPAEPVEDRDDDTRPPTDDAGGDSGGGDTALVVAGPAEVAPAPTPPRGPAPAARGRGRRGTGDGPAGAGIPKVDPLEDYGDEGILLSLEGKRLAADLFAQCLAKQVADVATAAGGRGKPGGVSQRRKAKAASSANASPAQQLVAPEVVAACVQRIVGGGIHANQWLAPLRWCTGGPPAMDIAGWFTLAGFAKVVKWLLVSHGEAVVWQRLRRVGVTPQGVLRDGVVLLAGDGGAATAPAPRVPRLPKNLGAAEDAANAKAQREFNKTNRRLANKLLKTYEAEGVNLDALSRRAPPASARGLRELEATQALKDLRKEVKSERRARKRKIRALRAGTAPPNYMKMVGASRRIVQMMDVRHDVKQMPESIAADEEPPVSLPMLMQ